MLVGGHARRKLEGSLLLLRRWSLLLLLLLLQESRVSGLGIAHGMVRRQWLVLLLLQSRLRHRSVLQLLLHLLLRDRRRRVQRVEAVRRRRGRAERVLLLLLLPPEALLLLLQQLLGLLLLLRLLQLPRLVAWQGGPATQVVRSRSGREPAATAAAGVRVSTAPTRLLAHARIARHPGKGGGTGRVVLEGLRAAKGRRRGRRVVVGEVHTGAGGGRSGGGGVVVVDLRVRDGVGGAATHAAAAPAVE